MPPRLVGGREDHDRKVRFRAFQAASAIDTIGPRWWQPSPAASATHEADKTPAIRDTPRRRFEERARRGHWPKFSISPTKYEPALAQEVSYDSLDRTFSVVRRLDKLWTKEAKRVEGCLAS